MDAHAYRDPVYLHRYYAGQALIGLLASGRLDAFVHGDLEKLSPEGPERIAKAVFAIADAMADEAAQHARQ